MRTQPAFEVREAAMRAGFMPDEATTLSLSLAELATNSVSSSRGAVPNAEVPRAPIR